MGKRRLVLRLACHKTVSDLAGSYPRALFSALVAIGGSYGAYFVATKLGRDWPGDELIPVYAGFGCLVIIWIAWFLYNCLLHVPYEQWGAVEGRVTELERTLRPRFSVVPSVGQRPVYSAPQHVAVTVGGTVHSNRTLSEQFLCIEITNHSASTLRGCEAYLSQLQQVGGEESGWHSTRLEWMPAGETDSAVDIPPLGVRSVMIFKVLGNRALFLTQQLPGDLVHYLQDRAEYQGLVTLTADGTPATFIAFVLTCAAPEQQPTITVMRRTIGDEPSDIPWARETNVV